LGFDTDVVNSVHFSNHTGYLNGFEGEVLEGKQLKQILKGLERNDLLENVEHILTGYIGSESFLEAVLDVIHALRRARGRKGKLVRFVCDPVLGDAGKFYVPEQLVDVYRNFVIPLADIVTPNQFEVEKLTGIEVDTIQNAKAACLTLHTLGPRLVFITSMVLKGDDDTIAILASQQKDSGELEMWRIDSPVLPGRFTGTGDLCTALLLAHTARDPDNLASAMEKVINTMYSVIKRTSEGSVPNSVASQELKLIQSKCDIEDPPTIFRAYRICE
jgi:pyridoxine kinase